MLNMSFETLRKSSKLSVHTILDSMISMEFDTSEARELGFAIAANGSMYDKSYEGVIPHAMSFLFNERKRVKGMMNVRKNEQEKYKTENSHLSNTAEYKAAIDKFGDDIAMLDAQQQALKILANSGYGAIGNAAFRYYREEIAEGITATGQLAIRYIANCINKFMNETCNTVNEDYVVAVDTDSNYITLNVWVNQNLDVGNLTKDQIVTKIDDYVTDILEPFIEHKYDELAKYLNCDNNLLIMKREAIADVAVWRAKKNYIINVYDNEHVRFAEPKLKMMGIETSRTSSPMVVRKELTTCLKYVIENDEAALKKEVENFKKLYYNLPVETIAVPRGVNDIDKWTLPGDRCMKGTPIHVRASINYNSLVKSKEEYLKRHEIIKDGTKIKFIKLVPNNPIGSHVVAYTDELPPEFGLHNYVDRKSLFEETFLRPLESFTKLVNYSIRHNNEINSFFVDQGESINLKSTTRVSVEEKTKSTKKKNTYKVASLNDLFGG